MKLTALASLVFCGLGVLAWPDQALAETAARARRPVTHEVLARVDASVAPAGFALLTHSRTAGNYEAGGMALGPRLGVNVGYGWAFSGNSRQNANLLIGQLLLGVSVGL